MEASPDNPNRDEAIFQLPNVEEERGEIERVARKYSPENPAAFVSSFLEKAKHGTLTDLTEEMWSTLDNTDSFDIPRDGWEKVAEHVAHTNTETGASRSWENLRRKMEQGGPLAAPIILRHGGELHLVSGNTRLMVARALGNKPKILLVEI